MNGTVEERLHRIIVEAIDKRRFICGIAAVGGPEIEHERQLLAIKIRTDRQSEIWTS